LAVSVRDQEPLLAAVEVANARVLRNYNIRLNIVQFPPKKVAIPPSMNFDWLVENEPTAKLTGQINEKISKLGRSKKKENTGGGASKRLLYN
jgi:hypothetical protein